MQHFETQNLMLENSNDFTLYPITLFIIGKVRDSDPQSCQ